MDEREEQIRRREHEAEHRGQTRGIVFCGN